MPDFSAAKALDELPEAFVSDTAISREVSRAVKAGRLRKLASRLYTRNLEVVTGAVTHIQRPFQVRSHYPLTP